MSVTDVARFLFASTAFPAHIDWGGLLATAVHLAAHGHDVLWATDARRLPQVAAAGLAVASIPVVDPYRGGASEEAEHDRSHAVRVWRSALRGGEADQAGAAANREYAYLVRTLLDAWVQEEMLATCVDAVLRVAREWRPDVMIGEPLMLPASIAAEAADIPLAGCGYPGPLLTINPVPELRAPLVHAARKLRRVRDRFGCKDTGDVVQLFCWSDRLQLVYFPPEWYGDLRAPRSANVHYVGGVPAAPAALAAPARDLDPPLVLVASSTSYLPPPGVLEAIFEAVRRVGGRVITAGQERTRTQLRDLPPHVQWESWIPYDEVMPRAAAVVHHGGLGTTHAAVRAAAPQLLLPGPIDQILHAEAIARAGAGTCYVGPIAADTITPLLRELLLRSRYTEQARALRDRFAECGGVPRAAELLVALGARAA